MCENQLDAVYACARNQKTRRPVHACVPGRCSSSFWRSHPRENQLASAQVCTRTQRSDGRGSCAWRDGSACHFRNTWHRFAIMGLDFVPVPFRVQLATSRILKAKILPFALGAIAKLLGHHLCTIAWHGIERITMSHLQKVALLGTIYILQ